MSRLPHMLLAHASTAAVPDDTWRYLMSVADDAMLVEIAGNEQLPAVVAAELYEACTAAAVRTTLVAREIVPTAMIAASLRDERRLTVLREAAELDTMPTAALHAIAAARTDDPQIAASVAAHPNATDALTGQMVARLLTLYADTNLSQAKRDVAREALVVHDPAGLLAQSLQTRDAAGATAGLHALDGPDGWRTTHPEAAAATVTLVAATHQPAGRNIDPVGDALVGAYIDQLAAGETLEDLPGGAELVALYHTADRTHRHSILVYRHSRRYADILARVDALQREGTAGSLREAWDLATGTLRRPELADAVGRLLADPKLDLSGCTLADFPMVANALPDRLLDGATPELLVARCRFMPKLLAILAKHRPDGDPALVAAAEMLSGDPDPIASVAGKIRAAAGGWRQLPASQLVVPKSRFQKGSATTSAALDAFAARPELLETVAALLDDFTGTVGQLYDTAVALADVDADAAAA